MNANYKMVTHFILMRLPWVLINNISRLVPNNYLCMWQNVVFAMFDQSCFVVTP